MADVQHASEPRASGKLTLAIDIGGTGLKASIVDEAGDMCTERVRIATPVGAPPAKIVEALAGLVAPLGSYDRVAVGFPGVVRDGRILTAANLGNDAWIGFDLARALAGALGKPVLVANDADIQGLAVVSGKGVEMVVTLGTGFGTGLYLDGRLGPHLEIAHQPFRQGRPTTSNWETPRARRSAPRDGTSASRRRSAICGALRTSIISISVAATRRRSTSSSIPT